MAPRIKRSHFLDGGYVRRSVSPRRRGSSMSCPQRITAVHRASMPEEENVLPHRRDDAVALVVLGENDE